MARTLDHIVDDAEFERDYKKQESPRSQRDVFFIWVILVFIAVLGSHFVMNIAAPSITGYVTATENPVENVTIMLHTFFVLFITIMIVAIIHFGMTEKDHH